MRSRGTVPIAENISANRVISSSVGFAFYNNGNIGGSRAWQVQPRRRIPSGAK
jgi:hypothetical protein